MFLSHCPVLWNPGGIYLKKKRWKARIIYEEIFVWFSIQNAKMIRRNRFDERQFFQ